MLLVPGTWRWGEYRGVDGNNWVSFWGTSLTVVAAVILGGAQLRAHDAAQREAAEEAIRREKDQQEQRRLDRERAALQELLRAIEGFASTHRSTPSMITGTATRRTAGRGDREKYNEWVNAAEAVRNRSAVWLSEVKLPHPEGATEAAPPAAAFAAQLREAISALRQVDLMVRELPAGHRRHTGKRGYEYLLECMIERTRQLLSSVEKSTDEKRSDIRWVADALAVETARALNPENV